MTSKNKKCRVVITIDEIYRQLFSIEEKNNGDLLIGIKSCLELNEENCTPYKKVLGQKYSIHCSPNSPSFTFKQTINYEDGSNEFTYMSILPKNDSFYSPIFSVLSPRLDDARYLAKIRKKDEIITLPKYHPNSRTLAYILIISSADTKNIHIPGSPFSRKILLFKNFNVHIWHTLLQAPSMQQGETVVLATSSKVKDGASVGDIRIKDYFLEDDQFKNLINYTLNRFKLTYAMKSVQYLKSNGYHVDNNYQMYIANKVKFEKPK